MGGGGSRSRSDFQLSAGFPIDFAFGDPARSIGNHDHTITVVTMQGLQLCEHNWRENP